MLRGLSLAFAVMIVSAAFITPAFAQEPSDLKVTLTTDKQTYAPGEPVNFTLTVTNTGAQETTLTFSSGQEVDYIVRQGGTDIWKWSTGRFFTQAVKMVPIAAGETRTYQDQWLQVSNSGPQVSNGEYTAVGIITVGPGLQSNTVTFTISEGQSGQPSPTATQQPGQASPTATGESGEPTLPQAGGPNTNILLTIAAVLGLAAVATSIAVRRRA